MANRSWVSTLTDLCWLPESCSEKVFWWERVKWLINSVCCGYRKERGHVRNRCLLSLGMFLKFSGFQLYHLQNKVNKTCVSEGSRSAQMVSWCPQRAPKHLFLAAYIPTYFMHPVPSCSHETPFVCAGWVWGREFNRLSHWKLLLRRAELEAFDRKDESLAVKGTHHHCPTNICELDIPPVFKSKGSVSQSGVICRGDMNPQINMLCLFSGDLGNRTNIFFSR